jgi:hypothetical protein
VVARVGRSMVLKAVTALRQARWNEAVMLVHELAAGNNAGSMCRFGKHCPHNPLRSCQRHDTRFKQVVVNQNKALLLVFMAVRLSCCILTSKMYHAIVVDAPGGIKLPYSMPAVRCDPSH